MPRRLIYEVNTRCWLRELSSQAGRALHLGAIPEAEFERWSRLGFTHIWLMGVWTTGPKARACYLEQTDTGRHLQEMLPDWTDEDVPGSPYAIASYQVPAALGGEDGLQRFRTSLRQRGMKLILDFVPNHVGLDHPWVIERPELFVQGFAGSGETIVVETKAGVRWLAHGKDPYFPAWVDTVQLDYRRTDTRAAIIGELKSVAGRCDGVRCDMAMLLLEDMFARTWTRHPVVGPLASGEFWAEALAAVNRPGFLFLAEAYWDLEERLQQMGFDLTYDKRVTDFVVERRPSELSRHLLGKSGEFLQRSVHFLENHDEPRIAGRLSLAAHRAAALLVLTLPGVCLLHEGQLTGARIRASVHLSRRPAEPVNGEVEAMYADLIAAVASSAVGHGDGQLLHPTPASPADDTAGSLVAVWWRNTAPDFDVAVVNLAPNAARGRAILDGIENRESDWLVSDRLDRRKGTHALKLRAGQGTLFELPAHGAQLLHFHPAEKA